MPKHPLSLTKPTNRASAKKAEAHKPVAKNDRHVSFVELANEGSFPRSARIVQTQDFQRVQRQGRRVQNAYFILCAHRRVETQGDRLGIAVSKRVGNAVLRIRLKRLLRESFRRWPGRDKQNRGCDLVVIVKLEAANLAHQGLHAVAREFHALLAQNRA